MADQAGVREPRRDNMGGGRGSGGRGGRGGRDRERDDGDELWFASVGGFGR